MDHMEKEESKHEWTDTSLDPTDWDAFRESSHRILDEMITFLQQVNQKKIWEPVPESTKEALKQPVPLDSQERDQIYEEFKEHILPYTIGNIHPRFWGWVIGTGTPIGIIAEMLAATMNTNHGGFDQSSVYVELQVLQWFKTLFGYPEESTGLLVSGGSMANLIGLTVARYAKVDEVRTRGLFDIGQQFIVYGSTEMHSSLDKAMELLGLGRNALRKILVNDQYEIDLNALEEQISKDRAEGFVPICIIGNAGTVNTGATDDLHALATLCEKENLWFHVDGAFGAITKLTPNYQHLANGMERADSIAFDLHKWMYIQYEAGAILIKNPETHYKTFALTVDYLAHGDRGVMGSSTWFNDLGVQLSRGFKALKVWMSIKEHGMTKYGKVVEQNILQAQYLTKLVESEEQLELLAPTSMNIVCFRYVGENKDTGTLNHLNQEIIYTLHENAVAIPSYTMINGNYAIRVAITNHRSRKSDFDELVRAVIFFGHQLEAKN
jgi:glutamate/tyrosine decarboxylase-like PLP-dependent enzyme